MAQDGMLDAWRRQIEDFEKDLGRLKSSDTSFLFGDADMRAMSIAKLEGIISDLKTLVAGFEANANRT